MAVRLALWLIFGLQLAALMSRSPIVNLSDSDAENFGDAKLLSQPSQPSQPSQANLARCVSQYDLTDDEDSDHLRQLAEAGMKKRKRRRAPAKPGTTRHADRMGDEKLTRALVERRCKGCRRCCLAGFLRKEEFRSLLTFRKEWSEMRNLDQDQMVSCLSFWG